jgi:hypothetical protein
VGSPVQQPSSVRNVACLFPDPSAENTRRVAGKQSSSRGLTALSVEFVAKPQVAHRAHSAISMAITAALHDVRGFAGCLVMVADQEARLVTVLTFWTGDDRFKRCGDHSRWVRKLLTPYLDRCLRVQTLVTDLKVPPLMRQGMETAGEYSGLQVLASEGAEVCVAS